MEGLFAVLQTLVVLAIVIGLAHISLRLLNRYMVKQNNIIKIWEKTSVNTNSSIGIVEVSGKYYLMSFTQNENKILEELDPQEIQEVLRQKEESMDIKENGFYKKINSLIEKRKEI
nr:flagellar biosynthetic protein FliO [Tissierella sp.]